MVRDVIAKHSGVGKATDESMAEKLKHVLSLTEKIDITVEKRKKETTEDPELTLLRQAILDGKEHNVPLNYKLFKDELSVEMRLVLVAIKLAVPKTLREWVIQVAHGDHWSTEKMAEFTELVYWPGKVRDLKEKSRSCMIGFQAGKNLKTMIPSTETNKLESAKYPLEELQIDFLEPLETVKGKKHFVIVAVDNYSKWIWGRVVRCCSTRAATKFLNKIVESDRVPKTIKVDNASAFKSVEFARYLEKLNLVVKFSTPYVHTPIGLVERIIQRVENYVKTYLLKKRSESGSKKGHQYDEIFLELQHQEDPF